MENGLGGRGNQEWGEQEKQRRPPKKEAQVADWGWVLKMGKRHQVDHALLLTRSFFRMDTDSSGFQVFPKVTSQAI